MLVESRRGHGKGFCRSAGPAPSAVGRTGSASGKNTSVLFGKRSRWFNQTTPRLVSKFKQVLRRELVVFCIVVDSATSNVTWIGRFAPAGPQIVPTAMLIRV